MRALAGWVLALSLVASPAFAAGSGGDSAGTSSSTTSDSSSSTASAVAKTDASALENEINDLRDMIDSQSKQMASQDDKLKVEQEKLQSLQEQLKAVTSVSTSAPATAAVTTANAARPSAEPNPSPAPAAAPQGGAAPAPSPLYFSIGSAHFTPLGFMDLTNVFRAPVIGSGIGTNFGALPYRTTGNFPASGLTEDRFSAQNSRLGIRIDANVAGGQAIGYLETDFLGNQAGTISVSSNSITLRMRVYFIDYTKGKIEILGGQDWSMLTPNRVGINPIPGNIFFSQDMDTNYQAGLVWERTPQFRFIYHASKAATFGVSLENANQYLGGGNGSGASIAATGFTLTGGGAQQVDNGASSNGLNIANVIPDIVVKAAFDPMVAKRNFHFEVSGLYKQFRVNTFIPPATGLSGGTSLNDSSSGGAVSANVNLEVIKNLHVIANSYWSDGGGQKIFGQAPDVVINPQPNATSAFQVRPLHSGSGIGGAEWQFVPKVMIYGYYGTIFISKDAFACTAAGGSPACGYGVATATASTAESQNRLIREGTIGVIPVFWRSPNYGALQLITQFSYLSRAPWVVVPTSPRMAHGVMAWVNLRYVLP